MNSRNRETKQTAKVKKMKNLFDVLDAIVNSDYKENLSDIEAIIAVAEAGNMVIISDMAGAIQEVGKNGLHEIKNGNGEWSKMRDEAEKQLVCYMHEHSGDVASRAQWKDDYDRMDAESWFGLPLEECEDKHWLDDQPCLMEVEWDAEEQEWVEI